MKKIYVTVFMWLFAMTSITLSLNAFKFINDSDKTVMVGYGYKAPKLEWDWEHGYKDIKAKKAWDKVLEKCGDPPHNRDCLKGKFYYTVEIGPNTTKDISATTLQRTVFGHSVSGYMEVFLEVGKNAYRWLSAFPRAQELDTISYDGQQVRKGLPGKKHTVHVVNVGSSELITVSGYSGEELESRYSDYAECQEKGGGTTRCLNLLKGKIYNILPGKAATLSITEPYLMYYGPHRREYPVEANPFVAEYVKYDGFSFIPITKEEFEKASGK